MVDPRTAPVPPFEPGPEHEALRSWIGDWTGSYTLYLEPGPGQRSGCEATVRALLGGRIIELAYTWTFEQGAAGAARPAAAGRPEASGAERSADEVSPEGRAADVADQDSKSVAHAGFYTLTWDASEGHWAGAHADSFHTGRSLLPMKGAGQPGGFRLEASFPAGPDRWGWPTTFVLDGGHLTVRTLVVQPGTDGDLAVEMVLAR